MQQDLAVERAASEGYDAWRAERVAAGVKGHRRGGPPKPYDPPVEPVGKINVTDPESRNVKSLRGWVQGYNAQAVVNENHIVLVAEVTIASPNFGHLEPMITATERQLEAIGVTEFGRRGSPVAHAPPASPHSARLPEICERRSPI